MIAITLTAAFFAAVATTFAILLVVAHAKIRRLDERAAASDKELTRVTAGEAPTSLVRAPEMLAIQVTPAELLRLIHDLSEPDRLDLLGRLLHDAEVSVTCFMENHRSRIRELEHEIVHLHEKANAAAVDPASEARAYLASRQMSAADDELGAEGGTWMGEAYSMVLGTGGPRDWLVAITAPGHEPHVAWFYSNDGVKYTEWLEPDSPLAQMAVTTASRSAGWEVRGESA